MSYPFHVANELNIKLVMYGENAELEYGGTLKNKDKYGQPIEDFVDLYHKGSSTTELIEEGKKIGLISQNETNHPSLKYFSLPKKKT